MRAGAPDSDSGSDCEWQKRRPALYKVIDAAFVVTSAFIRASTAKSYSRARIDFTQRFRRIIGRQSFLRRRTQDAFLSFKKKAGAHGSLLHPVTLAAFSFSFTTLLPGRNAAFCPVLTRTGFRRLSEYRFCEASNLRLKHSTRHQDQFAGRKKIRRPSRRVGRSCQCFR